MLPSRTHGGSHPSASTSVGFLRALVLHVLLRPLRTPTRTPASGSTPILTRARRTSPLRPRRRRPRPHRSNPPSWNGHEVPFDRTIILVIAGALLAFGSAVPRARMTTLLPPLAVPSVHSQSRPHSRPSPRARLKRHRPPHSHASSPSHPRPRRRLGLGERARPRRHPHRPPPFLLLGPQVFCDPRSASLSRVRWVDGVLTFIFFLPFVLRERGQEEVEGFVLESNRRLWGEGTPLLRSTRASVRIHPRRLVLFAVGR
ncbi:hypothetical protein B0H16DRAFT_451385 [Mycena metata]|uniref:Uncharacterized protein n=1 Tax=Mycena metata TaxID=1033252 RepID=A0AAD7MGR3_9AGAR|nr:hypothetical protein B0H16DRAFT_451385 [Mycena metata]